MILLLLLRCFSLHGARYQTVLIHMLPLVQDEMVALIETFAAHIAHVQLEGARAFGMSPIVLFKAMLGGKRT